ncbi:MAG: AI-2E family transporter [Bacteroidetes bacterium]|nr:AI-2E family transporter [Bacteroidota bacterium]
MATHPDSDDRIKRAASGPPVRHGERPEGPLRAAPVPVSPSDDGSSEGGQWSLDRIIRLALGAAGVALAGWLLWYFAGLVIYLIVGGILAYLLRPFVDRLQGVGIGRVPAILATFVLLFGAVVVLLTYIVPFVAQQVGDLSQLITTDAARQVANYIEDRLQLLFPIEEGVVVEGMREAINSLTRGGLVGEERVAETVSSVVAVFTNLFYALLVIPFVTFFFLKDGIQIRRTLLRLVPNRYFEITLSIIDKVERNIGRYFRALLVQCFSVAVVASLMLYLIGLDSALSVGLFTGLANTIPYFGPFLGFVAGTLVGVAQTGDLSLVLGVFVAMAITQAADNVLFQPLIFSRAARAHPMLILFVVLIGAQLAGIVGMLLAIPVATTVRVVVEQVAWSLRNYRIMRVRS